MAQKQANPIQLLIVIVIVVAIIAATQFFSNSKTGKRSEATLGSTYEAIKVKIDSLPHQKWNASMYSVLIEAIENSTTVPEDAKKDLTQALNAKYKGVLQDTLIGFSKFGKSLAIPSGMIQEMDALKKRSDERALSGIIAVRDTFNKYVGTIQSINGYAFSAPYHKPTSESYKGLLDYCKDAVVNLRENDFIKIQIDATIKALGSHGVLAAQFKICSLSDNCDCSKFTSNTYYSSECKKLEEKKKKEETEKK